MGVSRRNVLRAVGASALGLGASSSARSQPAGGPYVCPPCGCDRDRELFARPGVCPACGMALVEQGSAAAAVEHQAEARAAVLVFDGVQVIDFAAPYEVFGQAGYEVFTVAAEARPVTAAMGLRVTPAYSLADAPPAQILLVPGGGVRETEGDPRVLEWLRERAAAAAHVVSVCNGAFILAAAGLLDGLGATTFYDLLDALQARAPRTKVVRDRRFVDNGKVITTAGLSSGIDGALHVVSRLSGPARAQMAALNMEYDWKADGRYARAAFADAPIRRLLGRGLALPLPAPDRALLVSTSGDHRRWEVVWSVATSRPRDAVVKAAAAALEGRTDSWTRAGTRGAAWTLTETGARFEAALDAAMEAGRVRLTLRLQRQP